MAFLTNELVAGLKFLDHMPWSARGTWTPSKGDLGEVQRLGEDVEDFIDRVGMPEKGSERAAFRRLTRGAPAGGPAAGPCSRSWRRC